MPANREPTHGIGARLARALSWRLRNFYWATLEFPRRLQAWVAFERHRGDYQYVDEDDLRAARKSDTVFIFGSGYSLHALSPGEWRAIEAHDTIGFNWFVHQQFVRCDYHVIREIGQEKGWRVQVGEYFDLIRHNPHFSRTIFLVQTGFRAVNGNRAIGFQLLPPGHPVFLFKAASSPRLPSRSLRDGLVHTHGTLTDCINLAALLGWTRIVLCGVDLYDRRYFWLDDNQPRLGDTTVEGRHNTAVGGMVDGLREWREFYEREGVSLYVQNPKSLLAEVMPVWTWPVGQAAKTV